MKYWLLVFAPLLVAVAALLVAMRTCRQEPPWIDTHATQIHVGQWVADIPEHWRDIHELRTPIPGAGVPAPGARTLLYEAIEGGVLGQIDVFPMPPVHDEEGCQNLGNVLKDEGGSQGLVVDSVRAATFVGDRGCVLAIRIQDQSGLLLIRSHGVFGVAVRCLGREASLDGTGACDKLIYGLRLEF
ncbi:MAG TPA: hypothetical protein VFV99_30645 [Kofleriaceae bacterium]|nr:hypothetical protein [Kofleriaceae bacterium]